ncbi:MAG TPA: hypothetical protein VFW42_09630 [Fluviicoccus sp.]|nr:hypothetical protein [Fluviicoccus sp.]
MNTFPHTVAGFFGNRQEAVSVLNRLQDRGIPHDHLLIPANDQMTETTSDQSVDNPNSHATYKAILSNGIIGTVIGGGLGAAGELALVAANVSLFVASPIIAPLVMIGWGASVGALLGTTAGMVGENQVVQKPFSEVVDAAMENGYTVLIVHAVSEAETVLAREVLGSAVKDASRVVDG